MSNSVRIIGGKWRSRKIAFSPAKDLRPTPDRVRETLFNWIGPKIVGARCLDAFAGSGALGMEALSRGAAYVDFFDNQKSVLSCLTTALQSLEALDYAQVHADDALTFLSTAPVKPYQYIFLDPPYQSNSLLPALSYIADRGWLAPDGMVYVEMDLAASDNFGLNWVVHRAKVAAGVRYYVLRPA